MYSGLNIGSLAFEGELLDKYQDHGNRIFSSSNSSNSKDSSKKANSQILTNSGDPVNMALPKLQREINSASTPASKLLADYVIAEVENNSNRIDESVLKEDFYDILDRVCQKEHHQSFEELSKQSEYGAKRTCPPDQNTMNSFSECNVSQVSDPCSLLNAAKQAETDP